MKYQIIKIENKKYLTTNEDLMFGDLYAAKEKFSNDDWEIIEMKTSLSTFRILSIINPKMIRRKIIMKWTNK